MALDRYIEMLKRRWWVIVTPLILAVVAASFVTLLMPKTYEASAVTRIALAGQATGDPVDPQNAVRLTNTYVDILGSWPVLTGVIQDLNLDISPDELRGRTSVSALPDTELIRISARSRSPEEARDIANALANALVKEGRDFYLKSGSPSLAGSFSVVEPSVLPGGPVSPSWSLNLGIGLLIGLAAGLGLALVLEYVDPTLRAVKDLARVTPRLPVLTSISLTHNSYSNGTTPLLELGKGPNFPVSGEHRLLAANLRTLLAEHQIRSILITSPRPSQGTTTVVAAAGVALAQSGQKLLLVDANLEKPYLDKVFNLESWPGLRNVLMVSSDDRDMRERLSGAIQNTSLERLEVLTSGSDVGNPSWLLASEEMRKLIALLDSKTRVTIIDAPALLESGDAAALVPLVDSVVLVCAEGEATTDSVQEALEQIRNLGVRVVGMVYNKAAQR
jgi:succinoglycan biosynthesis transport protein ExoP